MFSNFNHTTTTRGYPQLIQEIVSDKWINKLYWMSSNHIHSILSYLKDIPRDNDDLVSALNQTLLNQKISELIVLDGIDLEITNEIRNVLPLLMDDMKDAKDIGRIVSLIVDRTRTKTIQSYTSFNTIYNYIWGSIDNTIRMIEERPTIGRTAIVCVSHHPLDNVPKDLLESHISSFLFKKSVELIHNKHTYNHTGTSENKQCILADHLKKLILLSYLLH